VPEGFDLSFEVGDSRSEVLARHVVERVDELGGADGADVDDAIAKDLIGTEVDEVVVAAAADAGGGRGVTAEYAGEGFGHVQSSKVS
jgi:hypothetical protein